ncbi:hypothetical protein DPMN_073959 [Dreissena polymorpha]|uniref:Uncharacterized protein n=1 Tax=Dreissena polymorpha TaxID=45954 RepID=A0A9D3YIR7_DREPO|nr:hypothetical protein DPMN_073959 [Dreissena polymorpha]
MKKIDAKKQIREMLYKRKHSQNGSTNIFSRLGVALWTSSRVSRMDTTCCRFLKYCHLRLCLERGVV